MTLGLVAEATGWPTPRAQQFSEVGIVLSEECGHRSQSSQGGVGDAALGRGAVGGLDGPGPTNGLWRDADWLLCRDGKWRPVESGSQPLAHGAAARVVRLRGYGNAIVAPAAAHFIASYLEAEADGFDLDRVGPGSLIDADLAELLG